MLIKSLLTGAVLAGVAGGVVYFGTGGEIDDVQLQNSVAEMKAGTKNVTKTVTTTITETIDDLTGKATRKEIVEEEIIEETPSEPTKKVESAKADKKSEVRVKEVPVKQTDPVEEPQERKWLDRYLSDKSETKGESQGEKPAEDLPLRGTETPQATQDVFEAKRVNIDGTTAQPVADSFDDNYRMILNQANNIQIIDLKNRAYLSLIDYTVREQQFDRGLEIIPKISQVELRDTARSNIAVGLARANQSKAAFEVIDRVETQALSDVLRLQVIEAISYPVEMMTPN